MSPVDSGYFAMLSRIKINEEIRAVLDLKCGDFSDTIRDLPGFTDSVRIKDAAWVGAVLGNNDSSVKKALDYAFKLAMNGKQVNVAQDQYFYIPPDDVEEKYKAQPIKPRKNLQKQADPDIPDKIRQMLKLYDYSLLPQKGRAKNFYVQARFMADYEDNYAEYFAFKRFYPTYHDMNIGQLRSYFTWRSKLRKGDYQKTSTSYAFFWISMSLILLQVWRRLLLCSTAATAPTSTPSSTTSSTSCTTVSRPTSSSSASSSGKWPVSNLFRACRTHRWWRWQAARRCASRRSLRGRAAHDRISTIPS